MELIVLKSGRQEFDSQHALGVGIVLACATEHPVRLVNQGASYLIQTPAKSIPAAVDLERVIPLPVEAQVTTFLTGTEPLPLPLAIFDGVLATQFTSPGAHVVSVYDLLRQAKRRPALIGDALKKARTLLEHLQKFVAVRASSWFIEALKAYAPEQPTLPVVGPTNCKDGLSIVLTMDPSFAFSVSRMVSDGWLTRGRNYSLHQPEYAPLFARIGASRALRAQRVAGGLVNYYMPLIEAEVELMPETVWPILPGASVSSKQAALLYLLNLLRGENHPNLQIDKFSYQILQPQGHHQSISIGYGAFSTGRMKQLQQRLGPGLMDGWCTLLSQEQSRTPLDLDLLVEFCETVSVAAWLTHLEDAAACWHFNSNSGLKPYSLKEVGEIIKMDNSNALRDIFEREQGTLRYGHALRLLGNYNPSLLRDLIDALRTVQTKEQIWLALAWAVQECQIAFARTDFIIIPDDEDLKQLTEDIERHTAPTIASLLIILSVLRYARTHKLAETEIDKANEREANPQ